MTDRGRDQLRTYAVKAGRLTDVTSADAPLVFSKDTEEVQEQRTAYGLAATTVQGQPIVAVTRRSETRVGSSGWFRTARARSPTAASAGSTSRAASS
ncbi:hypothetical protein [Kribbella antiqua]|uniref:hypothetical protein n=1 Tax=Kribbella antiqua TaxID=2512217 RepID=UPI0018EE496E|nr:hypothetical protein [Kribbella antiqua]